MDERTTHAEELRQGTGTYGGPRARRVRAELCLLAGLVLAVAYTGWLAPFARTAARVRADTLRLHVQANSDSAADQALKLQVRDAVLEAAGELFAAAPDAREVERRAAAALPALRRAAEGAVAAAGQTCPVTVRLCEQYFPTTRYEGFTLPAGAYRAVRVELGAHAGQNWWCVLYPGLCLPAGSAPAQYPETDEQTLVFGQYEVRFALVELWQRAVCRDIPAADGIG